METRFLIVLRSKDETYKEGRPPNVVVPHFLTPGT
jgi:hypothetical protein